jgi:hypothetical protein
MPNPLPLRLTEDARAAIDAFMASQDDECMPGLDVNHRFGEPREQWRVCAFGPERIRFFEHLAKCFGYDFFYECDGMIFILPQSHLPPRLSGRTLDYMLKRYVLR